MRDCLVEGMPLASRQHATGVEDFTWTSRNWLQGEAAAKTGHSNARDGPWLGDLT